MGSEDKRTIKKGVSRCKSVISLFFCENRKIYTMADIMVVGQVVGVNALAALGAAEWLVWLVNGIITGMTQGFSILISQIYGAQRIGDLKKTIALSYILTAIIAIIVLIISQISAYPILLFLNTPAEILPLSVKYIRILFLGIPIIAAYNIFAAVLRALGNSKAPLAAMVVAAVINIVLDILFVAGFGWGVAGAAAATVIAQGFSAFYCLLALGKIEIIRLEKSHMYIDKILSGKMIRLGMPLSFQNIIIAVGGLVVQYVVNGFGVLFVAGFTATNKLYGILEFAAISYGYAVTTYVGQNLGAGKYNRIKKGVHQGAWMAILTSAVISVVMILFGEKILLLFISGTAEEVQLVLEIAYRYLVVMSCMLWVLYLLYVYRSALQGLGNTVIPMASGIIEFFMRIGAALLLPMLIGSDGIFYAEVSAWFGAAALLMISYYIYIRKYRKVETSLS
ncbi:MAG: MATE family efflux transporter [Peptococcaceae bacterium]|nr:MATE family efflux transporter [Peptococcaceae bacterium]